MHALGNVFPSECFKSAERRSETNLYPNNKIKDSKYIKKESIKRGRYGLSLKKGFLWVILSLLKKI